MPQRNWLPEFWSEYHVCTLTTLRPDCRPHVVPVGVTLNADAGIARIVTHKSKGKSPTSRQHPREGARRRMPSGRRTLGDSGGHDRTDATTVDDAVTRYGRTPAPDPERVVIEITIDRVVGHVDVLKPKAASAAA
ncbi:pyridoxamine 5'-phosphate oxidase family protein [Streptomyces sp. NPDC051917]|uniref:pyridoxamine 5'-phosphate oxidase family protein n=1 Tax=Streptomyces sp. NPDC051917 TaxID=3154754 RepID=UPI00345209B3